MFAVEKGNNYMRKIIGILLMSLGTLLLAGAMFLLLWNQNENKKAEKTAGKVLIRIIEEAEQEDIIAESENLYEEQMPEKVVDGYGYIGYLTIPSLGIQLPVMSEWDYGRLRITPCRYYGSTVTDDLVIAAHNYASHFGKLGDINIGDVVSFTNMEGNTITYEVAEVNVLESTAVETMTDGEFDLRLFTCTYGGRTRLTVGCLRTK